MLQRRQSQLFIDRPPEIVWAFFARHHGLAGVGGTLVASLEQALVAHELETRITEWDPPSAFVAEQVRGPFARLRHRCRFEAFQQGTLITDRVEYEVPLGPLGALADRIWLGGALETAFARRRLEIKRLLEQGPKRLFKGDSEASAP